MHMWYPESRFFTHKLKSMSKAQPLFFHKDFKPSDGAVVSVQHKHGQGGQLGVGPSHRCGAPPQTSFLTPPCQQSQSPCKNKLRKGFFKWIFLIKGFIPQNLLIVLFRDNYLKNKWRKEHQSFPKRNFLWMVEDTSALLLKLKNLEKCRLLLIHTMKYRELRKFFFGPKQIKELWLIRKKVKVPEIYF